MLTSFCTRCIGIALGSTTENEIESSRWNIRWV
jgi:hypothetical protein